MILICCFVLFFVGFVEDGCCCGNCDTKDGCINKKNRKNTKVNIINTRKNWNGTSVINENYNYNYNYNNGSNYKSSISSNSNIKNYIDCCCSLCILLLLLILFVVWMINENILLNNDIDALSNKCLYPKYSESCYLNSTPQVQREIRFKSARDLKKKYAKEEAQRQKQRQMEKRMAERQKLINNPKWWMFGVLIVTIYMFRQ